MLKIGFIKCHGSSNDFIMVAEDELKGVTETQLAQFSRVVSDRRGSLGADGVLIVAKSTTMDGRMIMYNSDGSEGVMCGNGMRCVARKLFETFKGERLEIETKTGSVLCYQVPDVFPGVPSTSVVINPVNLKAAEVPIHYQALDIVRNAAIPEVDPQAVFTALSIPNPHLISIVSNIDQSRLETWGNAAIRLRSIFPEGINMSMVKLMGTNHIFVLTYERGCGITKACGTAMSASTYVVCLNGLCDFNAAVKVQTPGGLCTCRITTAASREVLLTGNASFEYSGTLYYDLSQQRLFALEIQQRFEKETACFHKMLKTLPHVL